MAAGLFGGGGVAHAYDRSSAANYADTWWNSANPHFMYFDGDDCTNFISQSVHAGSYPYRHLNQQVNLAWWMNTGAGTYTTDWVRANEFKPFLIGDLPGGYDAGTATGASTKASTGLSKGDVIFYDFQDDGVLDHSAIVVATGTDPNGSHRYGDLVDYHSNNRYHTFWSLVDNNPDPAHTHIYFVHIADSN